MSTKINYIFNAGASVKPSHAVFKSPAAIKSMLDKISDSSYKFSDADCMPDSDRTWENFRQEVIMDLQWLYDKIKNEVSIETFSAKLALQNQTQEVKKLRTVLSTYLTMVQLDKPSNNN